MTESIFRHGDLRLHYQVFGEGYDTLLAFHGIGGCGNDFQVMRRSLLKRFRVIAFDLFFHHSDSYFPPARIERQPLSREELCGMICAFLDEQGIDRFSVLGYSLGSKISLALLAALPHRMERVILLAPDGFHHSRWYDFACHRRIGRWLFRQITRYPNLFIVPASIAHRLRLVPDRLYIFVVVKMRETESRRLVFRVWLTFRDIDTPLDELRNVLREHQIPLVMIFGSQDLAIPVGIAKTISACLQPHASLIRVDRGHELLHTHVDELLEDYLNLESRRRVPATVP